MLFVPTAGATTYPAEYWAPHHAAWDNVLRAVVRGEGVDYMAVRRDHLPALDAYLDELATKRVDDLPRDAQLAYYLNLYNATMVRTVADRYRPGFSPAEGDYKVFKEPLVRTGGRTISLDDLEHKVIRPTFKDPRVHVALVCAARSCPPLLPRAYKADDLDETLEANMKRFVGDASRNQVDDETRQLRLSRIFDWFADDFGGKGAVPAYVGKYLGKDVADYGVTFLEYDWTLNDVGR
ncbi:MAG TPA: DUF547 domain-containing protein [Tepidisphaeraceae bacterium]|nr:DUF547 domain-containing protein [Tepidisphaeraceae bacterium]